MKTVATMNPKEWYPPTVLLVGLGLGREDLSVRASRWLEHAEVLAGGRRHLDAFPEFQGDKIPLEAPLEQALQRLKDLSERKRTAVLASGDPFFFGIGRRLAQYLGKDRLLSFPNATSVQALFAALGEAWEDVAVLSLHGGARLSRPDNWLREVKATSKVVLLTDPHRTPGWIAQELIAAGLTDRTLIVAEDLGSPAEKIQHLSLEEARNRGYSRLNMVVVCGPESNENPASGVGDLPVFGLPETAFEHEAGLITKMEVRAVVLAQLHLKPGLILWDLGAASGSVSIEAARLAMLKSVFPVEKHAHRYEALQRNINRFGLSGVYPVHGRAGDVLAGLPDPDRVFIGGSGEDLSEILGQAAGRLRPGGRVVQAMVTLDTLGAARAFWKGRPFEVSITQLQVNRAVAIAESLRFEALNPVFVLSATRKG